MDAVRHRQHVSGVSCRGIRQNLPVNEVHTKGSHFRSDHRYSIISHRCAFRLSSSAYSTQLFVQYCITSSPYAGADCDCKLCKFHQYPNPTIHCPPLHILGTSTSELSSCSSCCELGECRPWPGSYTSCASWRLSRTTGLGEKVGYGGCTSMSLDGVSTWFRYIYPREKVASIEIKCCRRLNRIYLSA